MGAIGGCRAAIGDYRGREQLLEPRGLQDTYRERAGPAAAIGAEGSYGGCRGPRAALGRAYRSWGGAIKDQGAPMRTYRLWEGAIDAGGQLYRGPRAL